MIAKMLWRRAQILGVTYSCKCVFVQWMTKSICNICPECNFDVLLSPVNRLQHRVGMSWLFVYVFMLIFKNEELKNSKDSFLENQTFSRNWIFRKKKTLIFIWIQSFPTKNSILLQKFLFPPSRCFDFCGTHSTRQIKSLVRPRVSIRFAIFRGWTNCGILIKSNDLFYELLLLWIKKIPKCMTCHLTIHTAGHMDR